MTPVQACGGVHGGTSPDGQGAGVHRVEGARLQVDRIPDGGCRPRGPEAAVRCSVGGVVAGPCAGQALCGGHGRGWGRCVCPQEPSAHPDHAAADQRRALYAFLRGDTPFCPPAGRVGWHPPWNPFDSLPNHLRATFQRAPLHALLVPRSYIAHEEPKSLFPHWMGASGSVPGWLGTFRHSGSGPVWYRRSRGPWCEVP